MRKTDEEENAINTITSYDYDGAVLPTPKLKWWVYATLGNR